MVVLLTLAFVLELIAFVGFTAVAFCFQLPNTFEIVLSILLFAIVVGFWSLYMAPKATKKLDPPLYYTAKLIIYAVAAIGLYKLWGALFCIGFVLFSIADELVLFRHNLSK